MIKYRLKCGDGHEFDAWFASSAAYEHQESEGHLDCPHCGRNDIARAVMAPRIATNQADRDPPALKSDNASAHTAFQSANATDAPRFRSLMHELRELREKILEKSEYVGPRFAEEARRIHHEESPDRAIHGEATSDEVHELADEGIDVIPIPHLPDDMN